MTEEILKFKNSYHQKDWYEILDDKELKKIVVAAPRGHSKSTCLSVNFPLQEIVRNPNIRILIVSHALEQSQMFLREIKSRIERDDNYREYSGNILPRYPEKWTDREIIVNRTNLDLKDATISTVGAGGSILARRSDLIICDDILSPENTRTPEQRKKTKDWFYEVLLPVLVPGGRLIVMGTLWHPDDLLSKLLQDQSMDFKEKYKAIISDSPRRDLWDEWTGLYYTKRADSKIFLEKHRSEMYKGVKVLWPERLNYEQLYLMRKENSISFAKSYQNEILSSEDAKFKDEWLDRAKAMGANFRLVRSLPENSGMRIITQGVDLAITEKDKGDDTCIVTLAQLPDKRLLLLNIVRGKFSPDTTRLNVLDQFNNFHPIQIKVENVAFQESMRKDLAGMNLPVKGYHTGGEKFDEDIGVNSLAILMENNRLVLPYDKTDPRTITLVDQLVDEMRKFPDGHTGDSLMAVWFAYIAHREIVGNSGGIYVSFGDKVYNPDKSYTSAMPNGVVPVTSELPKKVGGITTLPSSLPWKNEEERKKLELQADLAIIRASEKPRINSPYLNE